MCTLHILLNMWKEAFVNFCKVVNEKSKYCFFSNKNPTTKNNLWINNKLFSVRGGELFERIIEDNFVLDEQKCAGYMKQILRGVKYMHDNSVCFSSYFSSQFRFWCLLLIPKALFYIIKESYQTVYLLYILRCHVLFV